MNSKIVVEPPGPDEIWRRANRRELMDELRLVRASLHEGAQGSRETAPEASESDDEFSEDTQSALDAVCASFGLSEFERRIIMLCAGPELDGGFTESIAIANGDPARDYPTFGLALGALAGAHWSALSPLAPLRRWRLIELGSGLLTAAPLRIDEWLLHILAGAGGLDRRLSMMVSPLESTGPVPASAITSVAALIAAWSSPGAQTPVALRGPSRQPKRAIFVETCSVLGWRAFVINGADLPTSATERDELLCLWERESRFAPAALLVETADSDEPSLRVPLDRFVDLLAVPAAVALADGGRAGTKPAVIVDVGRPTKGEQRLMWETALDSEDRFAGLNGALDRVVAQFDLDPDAIAVAANRAVRRVESVPTDAGMQIWNACRVSARGGLDDVAQRLESTASFEDLVLPEMQGELLRTIVAHVKFRSQVYDSWQMSGPIRSGLGINALFSGPSGTGKTMAACVLANELSLDLYRIDLSQAVSKYIGETEKNLRRIFEAASGSGAVLLFDEADALFGKRSEVRDSHDRYANLEVSYLLQAMESYRGIAILTTNQRNALDQAFLRRLRFVVTFPFPGPAERQQIWSKAFPPAAPTRGLNVTKLAQLAVAGGNIRNIALHAAFAAAKTGVPIGMHEVLQAAAAEYAKLERPLSDVEIGSW